MDLQAIVEALNVSVNAGTAGLVGGLVGVLRAALGLRKTEDEAKATRNRNLTVLLAMVLGVGAVWLMDPAMAADGMREVIKNGVATGLLGGGMAKAATGASRAVRRR